MRPKLANFRVALLLVLLVVLVLELGLRLAGILDYPLYQKSGPLGYVLAPSQHGAFLNKNDWVFNDLSMGVREDFLPKEYGKNVLLIGDSIVLGGNPLSQAEKLGPLLQRKCKSAKIWPVGAASWALLNELRYLKLHEQILDELDEIVFVLNSGDFGAPSVWASEITHPTFYPTSALLYAIRKKFLDRVSEEAPGDGTWRLEIDWFLRRYKGSTVVLFYPTREEAADAGLRARSLDAHESDLGSRFRTLAVKSIEGWSAQYYRDGIHPTAEGNRRMAAFLAQHLPLCSAAP